MRHRDDWQAVVIGLAPAGLIGLTFIVLPVAFSLYLTLWDWPLIGPGRRFTGLANFVRLLRDPYFRQAFRVTVLYVLGSVPMETALALLLALLLRRPSPRRALYRMALFLPVVLSSVVVALFWKWAYQPQIGPINRLLRLLGLPGPGWLADPHWALPALVLIHLWRFAGYHAVLFIAGLRTIPSVYYEVALLDGAGRWACFRHVTWPLLWPTTALVLITGTIFAFQLFGPVYVLTGGGPVRSTTTLAFYLYERAFGFREMGYGAAIGWALFLVLFPLVALQFRVRREPV